jgi:PKD repeat protein
VHVYNTDGSFTVSLNATNPGGSNISTKTGYICTNCIRPIPPVADFTVNVTSGTLPLTVAFFGKTVGGPTNTWLWNFGDGQNSTLQNSVHKYNAKGNYSISLTIKNTAGTSTRVLPNWIRAGFDIITVNNTQNNSTISIAQNNIIRLGLNQCTSCGYEWSLNITPGLNVINTSFIKNPSLPGINGGSGQNVWDITAVSIGEQNITAVYKRPGIPLTGNELAFRLNITVNRQSTKIGTVRNNNTWLLDVSGNGAYGAGDLTYAFGKANDTYVTGDWNNDRKTEIGVFRDNTTWLLDTSGNGAWGTGDTTFAFGTKWDVPVTGDWNGDGKTEIGVVRNKTTWLLDTSGNGAWGTGDTTYTFGTKWDVPVTGDWNRNGKTEIGVFRNSTMWLLDYNGNGIWNGISIDRQYNYGLIKDIPVTGNW